VKLSEKAQKKCLYLWGIDGERTSYALWRWYDADTNEPRRLARPSDGKTLLWSLEGGEDGHTCIVLVDGKSWYAMPR
jgi:hypothetical protein